MNKKTCRRTAVVEDTSLPLSQTEAGDSDLRQSMSLAAWAAAVLVLPDLHLDVVGTLATRLIFAALLVHLV